MWRELTKNNEPQAAVFNAWLHAQSLLPGARLQMRTGDGRNVLVVGSVVDFDPPRRFAHTFRFTNTTIRCTVIYELKPVPKASRCLWSSRSCRSARAPRRRCTLARMILATLKAVVEDGRRVGTRIMYWMFGKMGFGAARAHAGRTQPM